MVCLQHVEACSGVVCTIFTVSCVLANRVATRELQEAQHDLNLHFLGMSAFQHFLSRDTHCLVIKPCAARASSEMLGRS